MNDGNTKLQWLNLYSTTYVSFHRASARVCVCMVVCVCTMWCGAVCINIVGYCRPICVYVCVCARCSCSGKTYMHVCTTVHVYFRCQINCQFWSLLFILLAISNCHSLSFSLAPTSIWWLQIDFYCRLSAILLCMCVYTICCFIQRISIEHFSN